MQGMAVSRINKLAWVAMVFAALPGLLVGSDDLPVVAEPDVATGRDLRFNIFLPLPWIMAMECNPITPAKVELGRMLFYDQRLSKNHDVACNTCHLLDSYGVDGLSTSVGHREPVRGRNAPTVYNAAGYIAQFWDGRSPNVEDQAKGPPLNPIEMAMTDAEAVVAVLESIPGYVTLFSTVYPDEKAPITFDNMAKAIGAFERGLVTPSRFDQYLDGEDDALTEPEKAGLVLFIETGCGNCHSGQYLGGGMYQKLGWTKSWDKDTDQGRFDVTGKKADRQVFKVPSLRNIAETGPYFHNGSIDTLDEAVSLMAEHQLGSTLDDEQVDTIVTFLKALTGEINLSYIARPKLPASSATTPAPDPG